MPAIFAIVQAVPEVHVHTHVEDTNLVKEEEVPSVRWSGEIIDVLYVSDLMRTSMERDLEHLAEEGTYREKTCNFASPQKISDCEYFASYQESTHMKKFFGDTSRQVRMNYSQKIGDRIARDYAYHALSRKRIWPGTASLYQVATPSLSG